MLIGTYTSLFDTPYAPWSTLFVLTLVVMISVVKGGLEDLKRHAADRLSNHRMVERLLPITAINSSDDDAEFELIEWRRVCVGDILRISNNSEIPADMVMLSSSEEVIKCFIFAFFKLFYFCIYFTFACILAFRDYFLILYVNVFY